MLAAAEARRTWAVLPGRDALRGTIESELLNIEAATSVQLEMLAQLTAST